MKNRDEIDFSGAGAVADWLHKNGVTSEEFRRNPNRWLELAINAVKNQATEKQVVNEVGTIGGTTTASIKGFFEGPTQRTERRKRKNKRIRAR